MKRHTLVYFFIGLTMVALAFGSLPLAAAEPSNAPAGVTETPAPGPTNTSAPPNTAAPTIAPAPTNTSVAANTPAPTSAPRPAPQDTRVPASANSSVSAPTSAATVPAIAGLPNTGGAAPQDGASPWIPILLASVIVFLGVLAFGLGARAVRATRR